ncbi:MAG: glycosyltransferase family 92 protein [Chlamydiota bacterium]|nr:glycosyltransferase family 92 protein [Chlamydiota bacterium]
MRTLSYYIRYTFFFFLFFQFSVHSAGKNRKKESYEYELAICTIFQNEAKYLKEWIEFHRIVGVEHFYLYNNNSTDHYLEVLDAYLKQGIVELTNWPGKAKWSWNDTQKNAYKDAIGKTKDKVKWLAIIDSDEFLFSPIENDLKVFLRNYEAYPALVVNWQCYGTSGVKSIPGDMLMIELLVNKAEVDHYDNHYVKSIVRPKYTIKSKGRIHHFYYKDHKYAVNANYETVKNFRTPSVSIDKIRINHYRTRDEDHFINVKLPRLKHWYETESRYIFDDHNAVYDDTILKFTEELHRRMGNRSLS